jgi:hypothetical protein
VTVLTLATGRLGLGPGRRRPGSAQPAPFTPASLPGLAFWYDAEESPVVESGGFVAELHDLSVNANNAEQGVTGARPLKTVDGHGRPVIAFDGQDDVLTVAGPPDLAGGATLFAVFRIRSRSDFSGIFACGAASGADHETFFTLQNATAASEELQVFGRSGEAQPLVVKGVDTGETQYVILRVEDAAALWRDIGGEQSAGSTATAFGTPAAIAIGARLDDAVPFGFGAVDLHEIGLFPRQLDATELDQLETYIQARHGLRWTPKQFGSALAWFHDVEASGLVLTGTAVDQWTDDSGNARHLIQSDGSRPVKTTDALGRATLRFDGVDDTLRMTGTLPALDPFTAAIVFTVRLEDDFSGILSAAPQSGPDVTDFWSLRMAASGNGAIELVGRDDEIDPLVLSRPQSGSTQIAVWTTATGSASLRDTAGEVSDSYDGGFGIPGEIVLGGRFDGSPYGSAAIDVFAVVGVDRVLTTDEQTQLIAWAEERWGI